MKKYIALLAAFITLIGVPVELEAKSRSFSRSSSSSSFSWSSKPKVSAPKVVTPKPVTPPKVTPAPSKGVFPSKKDVPNATSKPKTAFDTSQQRRSITPPKPKEQFVAEFKQKNAGKFPTTFDKEPAKRPDYIPPSSFHDGQIKRVEYNPQTRSYGFFDGLGMFIVYDALTDMAFGEHQKETIIYKQATEENKAAPTTKENVKPKEEDSGWEWLFIGILAVSILGTIVWIIFKYDA